MTLIDLLSELVAAGDLPAKQAKDYRTALRYLTSALGQRSPDLCPVDSVTQDVTGWLTALDAHFQSLADQGHPVSIFTVRNTRSSLRKIFSAAERRGLIAVPLPTPLLARIPRRTLTAQSRATAPYRATYHPTTGPRHFWLLLEDWPADVQAGWQEYQERCDGRIRETTFYAYSEHLKAYLGYLTHITRTEPTWDACFDPTKIRAFVRWHATRVGQRRTSAKGIAVIRTAAAIAKVIEHPHAAALRTMHVEIARPDPVHNKRAHHWVSLAQLEAVADACLQEGRLHPGNVKNSKRPGARRALAFQKGVMLKLLVRIPLRQRNVRELRLGDNLYKDDEGRWHLHFRGSDLKVGMRGNTVNEYHVNLSEDTDGLVPVIEEWMTVHRPKLPPPVADAVNLLFLTQSGRPFTDDSLSQEIKDAVTMRTGKRFFPHMIRTVWATEYLTAPETHGDYQTAATMLGDTLQVVIKTYYDVVNKDQHAKAKTFLASALKKKPA
jgi:hypothetical protein